MTVHTHKRQQRWTHSQETKYIWHKQLVITHVKLRFALSTMMGLENGHDQHIVWHFIKKLDLSQTRANWMPNQFHSFIHAYSMSFIQGRNLGKVKKIIYVILCMFKGILKLQADKGPCIPAALADAEALVVRSISQIKRPVASLGEQAN